MPKYDKQLFFCYIFSMCKNRCFNSLLILFFMTVRQAACFAAPANTIQSIISITGRQKADLLLASNSLAASSTNASLSLSPNHLAVNDLQNELILEKPDIVTEALFFLNQNSEKYTVLDIYNTLRAISSLKGLEYYSASRGKTRVLFEYSSIISDTKSQKEVPDTLLKSLPSAPEQLIIRQKDASFGDNSYVLTMKSGSDYVYQAASNNTTIKVGFINAVEPEKVNLRMYAIISEEGILVYIVSSAKFLRLPGLTTKLDTSFENRAKAVFSWFCAKLKSK